MIQKKLNTPATGPLSKAGKAIASVNAISHGIFGRPGLLLPGESRKEFEAHVLAIVTDLKPRGQVETEIAAGIAMKFWRLRRLSRYESAQCEVARQDYTKQNRVASLYQFQPEERLQGLASIPRTIAGDRILKFESHINRQLDKDLERFWAVRANRRIVKTNRPSATVAPALE